jgi:ppGpp synthetase/RelA/SpoT-type nucleotidyltranferase
MSLSDQQITECTERYMREYDRYAKMAEVVYQKCLDIVQKKLTVRATVQRRAKNPQSFADKLKKQKFRDKYDSVDEVFSGISDLAGVRIATYLESDRQQVVDEIIKEFSGQENGNPTVIVKDSPELGKHYRATHCQVFLLEEDVVELNKNLRATTCEIQVCSLLAHVFNEIEHDLQYKPLSGELSQAELEFIDQLGLLTKAGDLTIKRLLAETDERLSQRKGEFDDVHDFVARMRKELGMDTNFSANAGQLYEELEALGLNSPDAIEQAVCLDGGSIKDISTEEFDALQRYAEGKDIELLETGSSDVLLSGILKSKVDLILDSHPMGRGKGRPSRLAQIAKLYKQMKEESQQTSSEGS